MNEVYTLQLKTVGDHLEVTIPELGITVSTAPGKLTIDDALDAGTRAIITYHEERREKSLAS